VDGDVEHQTKRVDKNVPLAARDFLARIALVTMLAGAGCANHYRPSGAGYDPYQPSNFKTGL
jgi:hypothetical protein